MKILFLNNKSPWPIKDGGSLGTYNIEKSVFLQGNQIYSLNVNTLKHFVEPNTISEEYKSQFHPTFVTLDTNIKLIPAFLNLFTKKSYHVQRFISDDYKNALIEILKKHNFDVIQIDFVYLMPYLDVIKQYSNAPVFLRTHNVEHIIWERIYKNCTNPLKKIYLKHIYSTLKNYEINAFSKFDGIVAITQVDKDFIDKYAKGVSVEIFPFGLEKLPENKKSIKAEYPGFFHLGAMDWMPNIEGVDWFIEKVLPLIEKEKLDFNYCLAGRKMPKHLTNIKHPMINVIGEVEDAKDFVFSKSVLIAPLLSGSGVRVKIIEAMAACKTVITTSIGAEGINYKDGKNIIIANTPKQFVEKIKWCMENPEQCRLIGQNAKQIVENYHDLDSIGKKLTKFYLSKIKKNH